MSPGVPAPSLSSALTHRLSLKQEDWGCWYRLCRFVTRKMSVCFHFKFNVFCLCEDELGAFVHIGNKIFL